MSDDPSTVRTNATLDYSKLAEPFREVTGEDALFAYLFDKNKTMIGTSAAVEATLVVDVPCSDTDLQGKELEREAIRHVRDGCSLRCVRC